MVGSLAVEAAAAITAANANNGKFPPQYTKISYLFVRLLFALIAAGPLALAFDAPSAIAAIYTGASAPVLLDRLSQGLKPPED